MRHMMMKSFTSKYSTNWDIEVFKNFCLDTLKVLLGGAVLGLAYAKWMVPNEIINGGVTSLSLILQNITGISVTVYTQGLTIVFLLLSMIFLGGKNLVLSLISSFAYTTFFALFYNWDISLQVNIVVDVVLACVFIAVGYYLCISAGASTVGIEVIALIVHQRNKKWDLIKLMRLLNYSVLAGGFFIYGWKSIVVGVLFSYGYSAILKYLLNFRKGDKHE